MSYLPHPLSPAPVAISTPQRPRARPGRAMAIGVALLAAAAALLAPMDAPGAAAEPELTMLLRSMAVTKGGIALGVAWVVGWRLRHAAPWPITAALLVAVALLAAGAALIFRVAPAGTGALLFHGGLALTLLLAWVDRARIGALLAAARRR